MTREETAMIMAYLRELYPNGQPITEQTVMVWEDVFRGYAFEDIKAAAIETAKTYEGFTMPPPATIIKNIKSDKPELDQPEQLWNEALKLIRKGTVLTEDEFRKASEPVKQYFRDTTAIKEIALLETDHLQYEKGRFMKSIGEILDRCKREKSEQKLERLEGRAGLEKAIGY